MTQKLPNSTELLSPVQQAILEIRALRAKLQASENRQHEPIAILGVGCRFPGNVVDAESYWQLLSSGTDAIGPIPEDRWDQSALYDCNPDAPGKITTRWGGFLNDVDQFDAEFFGISDREAVSIDPQQRLLLEVGWQALLDAGQSPQRLFNTESGVFVGIGSFDYSHLRGQQGDTAELDAYHATGIAHSAASGRLSYYLGLQGPSVSIDTACSSSLVAIHLACQSLRSGECRLTLAGGVNLILSPDIHITLSKARMMAADGRCKAFDEKADGFVRSEGCGMVVLKRLSDAIADGDRIRAVIRGSAWNQDGRSSGLTAPNGPSQTAVLRAAWQDAGVAADRIDYVETHGTGTALGDPIEAGALAAAVNGSRSDRPLLIGSVKTNLGHLEAAAGVAGLIKTVLALEHEQIPSSLHFQTPSHNIDWKSIPLRVTAESTPWQRKDMSRIAGVSSFGFSGTNVHVVIEEAPLPVPIAASKYRKSHVLTVSAMNEPALTELASSYIEALESTDSLLADIAFTANTARSHFTHRIAVVASSLETAAAGLRAAIAGDTDASVKVGRASLINRPKIGFLFGSDISGNDATSAERIRELYDSVVPFREAIDRCAEILKEHVQRSLTTILFQADGNGIAATFLESRVARFAVQWATAQTWLAWGVEPDVIAGSADCEYVAACLAGVFPLEDGLRLAVARARLDESQSAGPNAAALAEFARVSQSLQYAAPRTPLGSSLSGQFFAPDEVPDTTYWIQQARAGVSNPGSKPQQTTDCEIVLEFGIVAGLSSMQQLLETLAQLYVQGVSIDWKKVDAGHSRTLVSLPAYPWKRKRYWFPVANPAQAGQPADKCWNAVLAAGEQQANQVPIDLALHTYGAKYRALDRLATSYIVNAFRKLGAFDRAGSTLRAQDLLERHGVLPVYRILMERWLRKLADEGLLTERGGNYTAPTPLSAPAPVVMEAEIRPLFDDAPMLYDYVQGCGQPMSDILIGRTSPLDTLFPDGSLDLAESIYHRAALSRYFNSIAGTLAGTYTQNKAGRIRVLEVGAGTGGTTASILPRLPADRTDYLFTDVSKFFFAHAERRFRPFSFLRYGLLDLEQSPTSQGYGSGQYDIVVAANVLHATKDLGQTLDFVRDLLAPDGMLILYEVTDPPSYFDVSIALIEGWQKFNDGMRGDSPLLPTAAWVKCLEARGFQDVKSWPGAGSPAEVLGSKVFVARAPGSGKQLPATAGQTMGSQAGESHSRAEEVILQQLADTPESEHGELLVSFVRRHVARILRRDGQAEIDRAHRLMDLGLDSLMAVELRNVLSEGLQLSQPLAATLIFDYPSVADIASHLMQQLQPAALDAVTPDATTANVAEPMIAPQPAVERVSRRLTAADLEQLSDDEIERMLSSKLDQL